MNLRREDDRKHWQLQMIRKKRDYVEKRTKGAVSTCSYISDDQQEAYMDTCPFVYAPSEPITGKADNENNYREPVKKNKMSYQQSSGLTITGESSKKRLRQTLGERVSGSEVKQLSNEPERLAATSKQRNNCV